MKNNTAFAAIASALLLGGCLNFSGPKPPPTLLTLSTPAPAADAGTGRNAARGAAITILVPTVPAALQTVRIPVRVSANEYAWIKDAQWVETPASLFQRLISDTIAQRTKRVVLDPRQTSVDPGHRLTGQLLDFGLDATNPSAPVARVRYDAVMTLADGTGIATRRFEAARPASGDNPRAIARALDEAAAEVAQQVADWVGAV